MASSPTPPPPPGPESPAPTLIPFGRGRPEWSAQPPAPEEIPQCRAEEALRTIPAPRPELAPASELTDALTFNLASLAETWPEAMRKELSELKLSQAKVSLPLSFVEQGLKAGKITVSWKHLRGWIKPPPMPVVSLRDDLALELPLKLLAPVFLARSKGSGSPRAKVAVDESIPNLFFGFPQKEPSAPPGVRAASADTNYFTRGDKGVVVANPDGTDASPTPGTRFVAKYATPNEVVSRAAGLEHVAGALIALPDGLLVASRLDAELNAETVAAFLPQIFAKVSQCTRELRMGDLNNLNFTVGDVPWKIFRVNAIYFAAVGRSKEPLPTAQLAALAAELDHRPKA